MCINNTKEKQGPIVYAIRSPQTQKYTYFQFGSSVGLKFFHIRIIVSSSLLKIKLFLLLCSVVTYLVGVAKVGTFNYFTSCKAKLVYVYCIHKNLSTKINSGAWEIYYLPFSETENRESGPKSWIRVDGGTYLSS